MFYHSAKVASLVLTLSLDLTLVHCDILVKLILIFCYFWPWQDREFVEMDLPFNGAPKRLAPSSSNPPSPSPSDAIANSIFTNCCGKTNCCRKVSTWKKYIFPLPRNAFPREGTGVKTDFFFCEKVSLLAVIGKKDGSQSIGASGKTFPPREVKLSHPGR